MIDQILAGHLSEQLIQDLDCSIALNKDFVLALNYEIWLLKLNKFKTHFKIYCFPLKINNFLHQFTSMEFTELTVTIQ